MAASNIRIQFLHLAKPIKPQIRVRQTLEIVVLYLIVPQYPISLPLVVHLFRI